MYLASSATASICLINHGVADEILSKMKKQAQEFFELPPQEKKRWARKPGSFEGYGQVFVTSEEQKLEWNDIIFLRALPTHVRNLIYGINYLQDSGTLVSFMAKALKLGAKEISNIYREGKYEVRMNLYPPCPEPERVTGISKHPDNCGITLLLDCGNLPGLQFLKDGKWVPVEPVDGAIAVNTGGIIEIMSNEICKAAIHRAVVNRLEQRLSISTFCFPDTSANIELAKPRKEVHV